LGGKEAPAGRRPSKKIDPYTFGEKKPLSPEKRLGPRARQRPCKGLSGGPVGAVDAEGGGPTSGANKKELTNDLRAIFVSF